jgi:hypothetical protein
LVGVASNVIGVLVQTLFAEAVMEMLGTNVAATVIVIALLVTVSGLTQLALDVSVHVMTSPFCRLLSV